MSQSSNTASCFSKPGPCGYRKQKYNPLCDTDEEAIGVMVNEELDIDSDDEMNLEIKGETVTEKSSNKKSESENENENETNGASVGGWKEVTLGNKKPKAFTVSKNAGPQFNLLPNAEPMDYFSLFFNDELLNNLL
jgi:hypothetical protein